MAGVRFIKGKHSSRRISTFIKPERKNTRMLSGVAYGGKRHDNQERIREEEVPVVKEDRTWEGEKLLFTSEKRLQGNHSRLAERKGSRGVISVNEGGWHAPV